MGSDIFKRADPAKMAAAIVQATTNFANPKILAEISKGLCAAMRGMARDNLGPTEHLAARGW